MKEKRRLEVFWETREITTISFRRGFSAAGFCQSCNAETRHLTVLEAAAILKISEFAVFRLIQTGQVHSTENADRRLLLCANTLLILAEENL